VSESTSIPVAEIVDLKAKLAEAEAQAAALRGQGEIPQAEAFEAMGDWCQARLAAAERSAK
jgi:hypothetical protein